MRSIIFIVFLFIAAAPVGGFILADFLDLEPAKFEGIPLEVDYPEIPHAPILEERPLLPQYIVYFYYFAATASALIALGSLIYGGIMYLASAGNVAIKASARDRIAGSVMGLVVLLAAYMILASINPNLRIFRLEKLPTPPISVPLVRPMERGTEIFEAQEVPVGTLIETVLDGITEKKRQELEQILKKVKWCSGRKDLPELKSRLKLFREGFMKELEICSQTVWDRADDLKKETEACDCGRTSPGGDCGAACGGGGQCVEPQDPCDRPAIEQKKEALRMAYKNMKEFVEAWRPIIEEYGQDITNLLSGTALLKEGLEPVNYDNFIERQQAIEEPGDQVTTEPFPGVRGPVWSSGYDSLNFYLDKEINEDVMRSWTGLSFVPSIELPPPPPGMPPGPDPSPGALSCPVSASTGTGFGVCGEAYYPGAPATKCHLGIDLHAVYGTPVYSAGSGEVKGVYRGCVDGTGSITNACGGGYGNWVAVWHPDLKLSTIYAHLRQNILVPIGSTVEQGQQIGEADQTGKSTASHLHFEVRSGGVFQTGTTFSAGTPLDPKQHSSCK